MVKISIQIASANGESKKVTDKIAYVNPQASNETLVEFAKKLANLTDNSYIGTTKITEEGID